MSVVRLVAGLDPRPGELPVHLAPLLRGRSLEIRLSDAGLLDPLVAQLRDLGRTRRVSIGVEDWRPPEPGWVGPAGFVPDLEERSVRAADGALEAHLSTHRPLPAHVLLAALVPVVRPHHPLPASSSPVVSVSDPAVVGLRRESRIGLRGRRIVPHHDVAVAAGPVVDVPADDAEVAVTTDSCAGLRIDGRVLPVVDLTRVNPVGASLLEAGRPRLGTLAVHGPRLVIDSAGERLVRPVAAPWTQREIDRLRELDGVRVDPTGDAVSVTRAMLEVAALGVLVRAERLPPAAYDVLAPPVRDNIEGGGFPAADLDDLEWMVCKTDQRRRVLWWHSADAALAAALSSTPAATEWPPTVSVVLASRRPHVVLTAMRRVARFDYPRLELVLGLHGSHRFTRPLLDQIRAAADQLPFPVTVSVFDADVRFGTVLAQLCSVAAGTLVTKVDDDDHYGPDHVTDLVLAHRYSGATLVGRLIEFVHMTREGVTRRRLFDNETYAEMVSGSTMLIARADLEEVGGWRPLSRGIDRGLLERVRRAGGLVYASHGLGHIVERRGSDHTWRDDDSAFARQVGAVWPGLLRHEVFGTDVDTVVADEEESEA